MSVYAQTPIGDNKILLAQGTYSMPCESMPKVNGQQMIDGKQALDMTKLEPYPLKENLAKLIKTIPQIIKENPETKDQINKQVTILVKTSIEKYK